MGSKSVTPPVIVIVGQTASGKTAASIKIAQKIGGEIICADSRTVYKGMDIGTAKPTKAEQSLVPHHLLDIIEPDQMFTVADFKQLAQKSIQDIFSRQKLPILVGGSGLYIDSVLYNFQFTKQADLELRQQLEQMNDEQLTTLLHTKNIDLTTLNTKNRRHVIRAIERGTNPPINSDIRQNTLIVGLKLSRQILEERVTRRVDQMFREGFLEEVDSLVKKYGDASEVLKAPGYKAALRYRAGEIDIDQAKVEFIKADLQLAKRQNTWFKRNKSIQWFEDSELLVAKAVEFAGYFDYN